MQRATHSSPSHPEFQRCAVAGHHALRSLGGALEVAYDFVIYSMFAAYIGATLLSCHADPFDSQVRSFSVFAVGYLARPLGGVIFSHFGDKYGRRRVFIVSMLSMSLATIGMGTAARQA